MTKPDAVLPRLLQQPPRRGTPYTGTVEGRPPFQQQLTFALDRQLTAFTDFPCDSSYPVHQPNRAACVPLKIHMPVAAHARPEIVGLTDIEQSVCFIVKKVHASLSRQRPEKRIAEMLAQRIGQREQP
jgi:hypothetical protein